MPIRTHLANSLNAFFSISYIPFVLPILLGFLHINNSQIWLYSCLLIAASTAIATYINHKPTIAGPGIASIAIIANTISTYIQDPSRIIAIIISTVILLFIISLSNLPNDFVNVLSNNIKRGFKAGVGLMFILIAFTLIQEKQIIYFLSLTIFFYLLRNYSIICPIICILITVYFNNSTNLNFNIIPPDSHTISFDISILPAVITLLFTMMIDCSITGNTLNPGNENNSLRIASISSILGGLSSIMPCSVYIESLIFPKDSSQYPAYYLALYFIILGILGNNIIIPNFISAALLAILGIKIILTTKPQLWLFKSPQIVIIMLIIAISRSFLYGIFFGLLFDALSLLYMQKPVPSKVFYWLLFLGVAIMSCFLCKFHI